MKALQIAMAVLLVFMVGCSRTFYLRSEATNLLSGPFVLQSGVQLDTEHHAYALVRKPSSHELSLRSRMQAIRFERIDYQDATIQQVAKDLIARQHAQGVERPIPVQVHITKWYRRSPHDPFNHELDEPTHLVPRVNLRAANHSLYALLSVISEITYLPVHIQEHGICLSQHPKEKSVQQDPRGDSLKAAPQD